MSQHPNGNVYPYPHQHNQQAYYQHVDANPQGHPLAPPPLPFQSHTASPIPIAHPGASQGLFDYTTSTYSSHGYQQGGYAAPQAQGYYAGVTPTPTSGHTGAGVYDQYGQYHPSGLHHVQPQQVQYSPQPYAGYAGQVRLSESTTNPGEQLQGYRHLQATVSPIPAAASPYGRSPTPAVPVTGTPTYLHPSVSPSLGGYEHQGHIQSPAPVSGPTSIDPSIFRQPLPVSPFSAPSAVLASNVGISSASPLAGAVAGPNHIEGSASPSKVPKIKLRLNPSAPSTSGAPFTSPAPLTGIIHSPPLGPGTSGSPSTMPGRHSGGSYVEHEIANTRPSRHASSMAQAQVKRQLADTDEEDEDDYTAPPPGGAVGVPGTRSSGRRISVKAGPHGNGVGMDHMDDGHRRSARERKPAQRYGEEDAFERNLGESSPALPSPPLKTTRVTLNTRGNGRRAKRIVDPDEDDEDAAGEDEYAAAGLDEEDEEAITPVRPRRAFPTQAPPQTNLAAPRRTSTSHPENGHSTRARHPPPAGRNTRSTRSKQYGDSEDENSFQPSGSGSDVDAFGSESDDHDRMIDDGSETATSDDDEGSYGRPKRRKARKAPSRSTRSAGAGRAAGGGGAGTRRSTRIKAAGSEDDDEEYGAGGNRRGAAARRTLRERKSQVNYAMPPLDISMEMAQADVLGSVGGRPAGAGRASLGGAGGLGAVGAGGGGSGSLGSRGKSTGARAREMVAGARFRGGTGWAGAGGMGGLGMGGRDMVRAMGEDTSDSDLDILAPPKSATAAGSGIASAAAAGGSGGAAGMVGAGGAKVGAPTDVANFGRINPKSSTADADPLGVDMNVTFDNVGGLDDHINQLKEMVALPLLYPEVFQQFGITPPRGVLFHGPPGTGKTLLARALAASCSTGNTKIAFFMRKGADVLSKWVGEAERQLRMLFEEARAAQPSIIFFDEIDGLAPVRSSKQDQIHASLVSTLLALMDGMDGRGQVIVIGATNRPDSVDPALRRPGRFDREFYFPLPNKEARKKIIRINTRKWSPPLGDGIVERLAGLTKGYGGADMRALCTEAALNAIQRRYPQIYKSTDRYELDTSSIEVKAKDFMMSIKKIIPSSARSTSSTAIPLPAHLVPLLSAPLDRIKKKVDDVLPRHKVQTALEEAMFEDDEADLGEEGAILVQSLDKMRTYRPRLLVSGAAGMGQSYLGAAILHHLEGFHVQNLDLGVLLGDSGRSPEAALVQLFIEAKRHQPSIIYVPNLSAWSTTLSDSARATFKSLLDSIQPSEPVLLLGVVEEEEVSAEVRGWFGWGGEGDVELAAPTEAERAEYFLPLLTHLQTPPTSWPDALPRRPRVFEKLPLAAPLPERQPTQAEVDAERERDKSAMNMMVLSFTGLLSDWAKRYKRLVAQLRDEVFELHHILVSQSVVAEPAQAADITAVDGTAPAYANGDDLEIPSIALQPPTQQVAEGAPASMILDDTYGAIPAPTPGLADSSSFDIPDEAALGTAPIEPIGSADAATAPAPAQTAAAPAGPDWTPYDLDLDKLQLKLIKFKYHRPRDFLDDIDRIKANAEHLGDLDKLNKVAEMTAHAYLHVSEFEPKWMPEFEAFAERMRRRKEERRAVKIKEKEKEQAAEKQKEASGEKEQGEVHSSVDGGGHEAAGQAMEGADVQVNGSTHKRPRDGDDVDMDADREDVKRARSNEPSGMSAMPAGSTVSGDVEATVPPPMPASAGPEATASALIEPSDIDVPAPVAPVYPPFVVPLESLAELTRSLRIDTADFTIEQLEQLRASVFDRIWKSRALWDRTALVEDLRQVLGAFVKNAKRVKAARS